MVVFTQSCMQDTNMQDYFPRNCSQPTILYPLNHQRSVTTMVNDVINLELEWFPVQALVFVYPEFTVSSLGICSCCTGMTTGATLLCIAGILLSYCPRPPISMWSITFCQLLCIESIISMFVHQSNLYNFNALFASR